MNEDEKIEEFPFATHLPEWIQTYALAMRDCATAMTKESDKEQFLEAAREAERFLATLGR